MINRLRRPGSRENRAKNINGSASECVGRFVCELKMVWNSVGFQGFSVDEDGWASFVIFIQMFRAKFLFIKNLIYLDSFVESQSVYLSNYFS